MEETGRLLSAAHGTSVKDIKVVALAGSKWYTGMVETRGCSSLVEYDLPKVGRRVRFPSAAGTSPGAIQGTFFSSQRPISPALVLSENGRVSGRRGARRKAPEGKIKKVGRDKGREKELSAYKSGVAGILSHRFLNFFLRQFRFVFAPLGNDQSSWRKKICPSSSMWSMIAREHTSYPEERRKLPPSWKPFSMAMPMPATSAPA